MTFAETTWVAIGLAGQACFTMRFLWQWIVSERSKQSVVPVSFWYWSLGGGITLLAYALYRRDPVFVLGQATGVFVYVRNLMLLHGAGRTAAA